MQTECRDASLLVIYAEVQLILCKDNAKIQHLFHLISSFYLFFIFLY